jgi:anaerobic selenocysteine-containing dehydrogenase
VSNLCHVSRQIAFMQTFGGRPEPDYEHAQLIIYWGANPVASTRYSSYASYDGFHTIIPRARERKVTIIAVDPMRSETVALADQWVRPRLGTDAALGLGMAHTIIAEGLFDRTFVDGWVPGFEDIQRHVAELTPEWAERITGVPADQIRDLARLYARTEAAIIQDGNGLEMHTNGVDAARVICLLIALTGKIDRPGCNVFFSIVPQRLLPTVKSQSAWIGQEEFPLFPSVTFPAVKRALLGDEVGRPRAGIVHHSNPVLAHANQKNTAQALRRLDFLIACDILPMATTALADLVLPMASDFERLDYRAYASSRGGFLALREKVVEPVGESRSVFEVEYELAKRMGLEAGYPFTNTEEWVNFSLQPTRLTLADLRANPVCYAAPPVAYRKYLQGGFNTPSRKVQCVSERFAAHGYGALPIYRPPQGAADGEAGTAKRFPLLGTTRRPAEFVHTRFKDLAPLEHMYPEPRVMVHPADAAALGITADWPVEVRSPHGKMRARALVSEQIGPGVVAVDYGWGNPTDSSSNLNGLTRDDCWDPISGGTPHRLFSCTLRPARAPRTRKKTEIAK